MEDAIRQRIKDILSAHDTNPNKLAGADANFQNRLSRQLNQGATISCDTLMRVLMAFPDVSAEWAVRGNGEMRLADSLPAFNGEESETEIELHAELARKTAELEEMKLQVLRLDAQKEYLQERNDDLIVTCRMLQDELNKYQ